MRMRLTTGLSCRGRQLRTLVKGSSNSRLLDILGNLLLVILGNLLLGIQGNLPPGILGNRLLVILGNLPPGILGNLPPGILGNLPLDIQGIHQPGTRGSRIHSRDTLGSHRLGTRRTDSIQDMDSRGTQGMGINVRKVKAKHTNIYY